MYFNRDDISWGNEPKLLSPAFSAAWFHIDGHVPPTMDELISNKVLIPVQEYTPDGALEIFDIFADLSLRGISGEQARSALIEKKWDVKNPKVAKFLLEADIVLETSPPIHKQLRSLIKGGSIVVAGLYVAHEALHDCNHLWMILGAPGGIIIIGLAAGIGNGLNAGFTDLISRLFKKIK